MSIEWLVELGWKSALLAGATLALLALARGRSAAEKALLGDAGLLSLLLLPFALAWLPRFAVAAPPVLAPAINSVAQAQVTAVPDALPAAVATAENAAAIDWNAVALALYLLPALALALGLLVGIVRLRQLYSRARVVEDSRWLRALASAQNRAGVKRGTALLISDEVNSPISWGIVRPVIMIDRLARAQSNRAEAIIAHELAHVYRFDWLRLVIARLVTAIFWFNPLVWALTRSCHQLREEAADDAVLRTRVATSDYAELLVTAVRHANSRPLLAANGVAPSLGSLSRRVMRVLDGSHSRVPAPLGWTLACCAGALLINAPLGAATLVAERGSVEKIVAAAAAGGSGQSLVAPPRQIAAPLGTVSRRKADLPVADAQSRDAPPAAQAAADARTLSPPFAEAIIAAARKGDIRTLAELIAQGASPNSAVLGDGTPLIAATRAGRRDAVEFLLANGAHPDAGVPGDGNPLIVAAHSGRRDLVELLLARGASINGAVVGDGAPLIAASAAGHVDTARLLLDRGANPEQIVPGDENALITASRAGQVRIVELLIARGANVNSRAFGRTPLSMAKRGGHGEIVRMLTQAGAVR